MFRPTFLLSVVLLASVVSCSRPTPSTAPKSSTPDIRATTTPSPTKETSTAGRDVSTYAFGGRLGCKTPLIRESRRCQSSLRKVRDFIWSHWGDKKRGYVVVTITSPDAASDVHMFIEPDDT